MRLPEKNELICTNLPLGIHTLVNEHDKSSEQKRKKQKTTEQYSKRSLSS